jgi:hypothetical protein
MGKAFGAATMLADTGKKRINCRFAPREHEA